MALRLGAGRTSLKTGNFQVQGSDDSEGNIVLVPRTRLVKLFHRLPPWSHLPLACCGVLIVLLAAMLPVYYKFKSTNEQQEAPVTWPSGVTIEGMSLLDQVTLELDLVDVRPAQREVEWLVELSFGGTYGADAEPGVFDIGEGLDMVVRLGKRQSLKLTRGDSLSDVSVTMIVEDVSPLMNYPFDSYKSEFEVTSLIVDTSVEPYMETLLPTGLVLYEGELGWETHTEVTGLYYDNSTDSYGYNFSMTVVRSTSVKFFSMFIVILMWLISLFVFVLALNYTLTATNEISYDVPGLAVGLLFALPFVRDVQPNVPVVGATIDVFGFFWNVALVAGAAIIVLAALATRVQRNTIRRFEAAEAALAAAQQAQQGGASAAVAGATANILPATAQDDSAKRPAGSVMVAPRGWSAGKEAV